MAKNKYRNKYGEEYVYVSDLGKSISQIMQSEEFRRKYKTPEEIYQGVVDMERSVYDTAKEKYPGGLDQFKKDYDGTLKWLDEMRNKQYNIAQQSINAKFNDKTEFWGSVSDMLTLGQKTGAVVGGLTQAAARAEEAVAFVSDSLGYEDFADYLRRSSDYMLNRGGWNDITDIIGGITQEAEEKGFVAGNEIGNFMLNALGLPDLKDIEGESLQRKILEQEGLIDKDGKPTDAWIESMELAGGIGDFVRIITLMRAMPGAGVGGAVHAARYATAATLNNMITVPIEQQSTIKNLGIFGSSFAALSAGSFLSKKVMHMPLLKPMLEKLPGMAYEFLAGRVSDVGESVANSIRIAIQTGNVKDAIVGFPAALIANFVEEILIDVPGIAGTGFGGFNQGRIVQTKIGMDIVQDKIDSLQAKDTKRARKNIKKLTKVYNKLEGVYNNRIDQFKDYAKKNKDFITERIINDEESRRLYAMLKDKHKAEGMNDIEAKESAIKDIVTKQIDMQAAYSQLPAVAQIMDQTSKVMSGIVDGTKKLLGRKHGTKEHKPSEDWERIEAQRQSGEMTMDEYDQMRFERYFDGQKTANTNTVDYGTQIVNENRDVAEVVNINKDGQKYKNFEIEHENGKREEITLEEMKKWKIHRNAKQEGADEIAERWPVMNKWVKQIGGHLDPDLAKEAVGETVVNDIRDANPAYYMSLFRKGGKDIAGVLESLQQEVETGTYDEDRHSIPGVDLRTTGPSAPSELDNAESLMETFVAEATGKQVEREQQYEEYTREAIERETGAPLAEVSEQTEEEIMGEEARREETEEDYWAWRAEMLEDEKHFSVEGVDNHDFTDNAHATLNELVSRLPEDMQKIVHVIGRHHIFVDRERYKERMGRDYPGVEGPSGAFSVLDGRGLIEIAYGASTTSQYHEWFHFSQAFMLNENELKFLDDTIGGIEEQAHAFAEWAVKNQESKTAIGRAFNKIMDFFRGVYNIFRKRGFNSVNSIFRNVRNGTVTAIRRRNSLSQYYKDRTPDSGVFTEDGYIRTTNDITDVDNAFGNGYLAKRVTDKQQVTYEIPGKTNDDYASQIEEDLQNIPNGSEQLIHIEDSENIWNFSAKEYQESGNLTDVMQNKSIKIKKEYGENDGARIRYEEKPVDPAELASEDGRLSTLMKKGGQYVDKTLEKIFGKQQWKKIKKREDMWKIEFLDLVHNNAERWDAVHDIAYEITAERESAKQAKIQQDVNKIHAYCNELPADERKIVSRMLVKGDINEYEYGTIEEVKNGENLSGEGADKIASAYLQVREALDDAVVFNIDNLNRQKRELLQEQAEIIERLRKRHETRRAEGELIEEGLSEEVESAIESIDDEIAEIDRSIEIWENRRNKGYMPRTWFGNHEIRFNINKKDLVGERGRKIREALQEIDDAKGEVTSEMTWKGAVKKVKEDGYANVLFTVQGSNLVTPMRVRKFVELLEDAGITELDNKLRYGKRGENENLFSGVNREKEMEVTDEVIDRVIAQKGEENKAILNSVRYMLHKLSYATGHRRHWLKRTGTLGYDTSDIPGALLSYFTGLAGLESKRRAAIKYAKRITEIPANKKRLKKYCRGLVKQLLHNTNEFDKLSNKVTSFFFARYLFLSPRFTIRNFTQPFYMGAPMLFAQGHGMLESMREVSKAYKDIVGLKLKQRKALISEQTPGQFMDMLKDYNTISPEDARALVSIFYQISPGTFKKGHMNLYREFQENTDNKAIKAGRAIKNLYGKYIDLAGKSISFSDMQNRLIVGLAGYRMSRRKRGKDAEPDMVDYTDTIRDIDIHDMPTGLIDSVSVDNAIKATQDSNVVYAGWNVPSVFWEGGALRKVKPLFQFQRFVWHTLTRQLHMGLSGWRGQGAVAQIWAMTALFGGTSTIPFWDVWVKIVGKALGIDRPEKLREKMIEELGGMEEIMNLLDHGLFGLGGYGIDMRYSMQLRPLSVLDPLFGDNVLMGMVNDIKYGADDLKRGRTLDAIFEHFTPTGWTKTLWRSYRQWKQGATTYTGDLVLDVNGKPLRLSTYELILSGLGFMPVRIGNHFAVTNSVKELRSYYSERKSNIGTKYKIARLNKDKNEMEAVKREIEQFNENLKHHEINGTLAVPKITEKTLKMWKKSAGTKRSQKLARGLSTF